MHSNQISLTNDNQDDQDGDVCMQEETDSKPPSTTTTDTTPSNTNDISNNTTNNTDNNNKHNNGISDITGLDFPFTFESPSRIGSPTLPQIGKIPLVLTPTRRPSLLHSPARGKFMNSPDLRKNMQKTTLMKIMKERDQNMMETDDTDVNPNSYQSAKKRKFKHARDDIHVVVPNLQPQTGSLYDDLLNTPLKRSITPSRPVSALGFGSPGIPLLSAPGTPVRQQPSSSSQFGSPLPISQQDSIPVELQAELYSFMKEYHALQSTLLTSTRRHRSQTFDVSIVKSMLQQVNQIQALYKQHENLVKYFHGRQQAWDDAWTKFTAPQTVVNGNAAPPLSVIPPIPSSSANSSTVNSPIPTYYVTHQQPQQQQPQQYPFEIPVKPSLPASPYIASPQQRTSTTPQTRRQQHDHFNRTLTAQLNDYKQSPNHKNPHRQHLHASPSPKHSPAKTKHYHPYRYQPSPSKSKAENVATDVNGTPIKLSIDGMWSPNVRVSEKRHSNRRNVNSSNSSGSAKIGGFMDLDMN